MWELYWLTRVDGISVVLCIVLLISVVATVSLGVCYLSGGAGNLWRVQKNTSEYH